MRTLLSIPGFLVLTWTTLAETPNPVVLENPFFRYIISADARNVSFVDRTTGTDSLQTNPPSPCAWVRLAGNDHPAT